LLFFCNRPQRRILDQKVANKHVKRRDPQWVISTTCIRNDAWVWRTWCTSMMNIIHVHSRDLWVTDATSSFSSVRHLHITSIDNHLEH
jgi:hypothetical protein